MSFREVRNFSLLYVARVATYVLSPLKTRLREDWIQTEGSGGQQPQARKETEERGWLMRLQSLLLQQHGQAGSQPKPARRKRERTEADDSTHRARARLVNVTVGLLVGRKTRNSAPVTLRQKPVAELEFSGGLDSFDSTLPDRICDSSSHDRSVSEASGHHW